MRSIRFDPVSPIIFDSMLINGPLDQGMDARAERAVHNSLVEVTCKEDSSQYFLITPKLLPDLRYDERMKILCVNNGEWLPEEKVGDLMGLITSFVQRNAQPQASA